MAHSEGLVFISRHFLVLQYFLAEFEIDFFYISEILVENIIIYNI